MTKNIRYSSVENDFLISFIANDDINAINKLSYQKRRNHERAQPQFWKWAGESGEKAQIDWFLDLLKCNKHICLSAKFSGKIVGFIIGKTISAPEVYSPDGLTLMIDDFCVENDEWEIIGNVLIDKIKLQAKDKGVSQILVVCGSHDVQKKLFLKKINLSIASEWFVGNV
jgi:hypothetical protein